MGDLPGHEFHGNQWTKIASAAIKHAEAGRVSGMSRGYTLMGGGEYVKKMPLSNETPHPPDELHKEIVRQLEARGFIKTEDRNSYGDRIVKLMKPGIGTHTVERRHLGVIPGDYAQGFRGRNEVRLNFRADPGVWTPANRTD
jgi:hypothetical protein